MRAIYPFNPFHLKYLEDFLLNKNQSISWRKILKHQVIYQTVLLNQLG